MKAQRGFTLIEMMVSLVVFSFAIAGVLAVAVSMSQGYRDQRANVTAEGAARVPMDFIADAIRQASPGAPTGLIYDGYQAACGSNAVTVTDGGTGSADAIDLIYASGAVVTTTYDPTGVGAGITVTNATMTIPVQETSGLSVGDGIVLSNTAQGHYFILTGVSTASGQGNLTVVSTCNTNTVYPVGSSVIRAQHAVFYIDQANNVLMMNPSPTGTISTDIAASGNQPLADGVEDMQLALAIDTTSNTATVMADSGAANTDSWLYNVAGETLPAQNTSPNMLRAIRITLIARTATQLLGTSKLFNRPAAEDRTAGSTDNYRRRVLKATAEIRGMGESP